jgi:sugar/nucleoside kinase (ribokinase family)
MTREGTAGSEVLVVGEYFCDLIFAGLSDVPRPGAEFFAGGLTIRPGGCYNMALALTRLGIDTSWAVDFGTDLFSGLVLEQSTRDRINPVAFNLLAHEVQRVSAAFTHGGERGFISYSQTDVLPPPVGLLDRLEPQWLLQSFRFTPPWLDFLRAARARGIRVFADCAHGDFTLSTPGIHEFLSLVDIFSPNEAEALSLTGRREVDEAIEDLLALAPAVLVKCGSLGATGVARGRHFDVAAPLVEVVDTVGAGDAFNAGFLAGAIWESGFEECVRLAVACGTLSTLGAGNAALPDGAELSAYAARLPGARPPPNSMSCLAFLTS